MPARRREVGVMMSSNKKGAMSRERPLAESRMQKMLYKWSHLTTARYRTVKRI